MENGPGHRTSWGLPLNRRAGQYFEDHFLRTKVSVGPQEDRLALWPGKLSWGHSWLGVIIKDIVSPQRPLLFLWTVTASTVINHTQQVITAAFLDLTRVPSTSTVCHIMKLSQQALPIALHKKAEDAQPLSIAFPPWMLRCERGDRSTCLPSVFLLVNSSVWG